MSPVKEGFKERLPITPSMAEVQSEQPVLDDSNRVFVNSLQPPLSDFVSNGANKAASAANKVDLVRAEILQNAKTEISSLLALSQEVDKISPLIYDGEHVVQQLQSIEMFYDTLQDNLSEVRDYMMALQEYIEEQTNDSTVQLIPNLKRVIKLLIQVCPLPLNDSITPGIASREEYKAVAAPTPLNQAKPELEEIQLSPFK